MLLFLSLFWSFGRRKEQISALYFRSVKLLYLYIKEKEKEKKKQSTLTPNEDENKKAPPPPFKPIGKIGTEGNPLPSCQAIFEKNPNTKSGSFWLMTNGVRYKTYCDIDIATRRGWTLVARVNGTGNDFTAVSNAWADDSVFNHETADDISAQSAMKNHGWFLLKANAIKVCFKGVGKDCAIFSHNLGMRLNELFAQEYGVIVEQKWTFSKLLNSFGKSCDTSKIKKEWCGLNLANICHPEDMNPNLNPTNHIVRIGCIGALSWTCTPGDYAIGVGVTSCYDGYGCERVGPRTPSMHWSCPPNYGAFDQTGFIYTWCEFIKEDGDPGENDERPPLAGGWTLVARVKGQANDWSPVSDLWYNNETLNEGTAGDVKRTTSMKNVGWNLLKSDVLLLCFTGHTSGCAPFTHSKRTTLQDLFKNHYGVVPEEQYTMAPFMKAIGKSCDLSILRQSWCGLNLANVCNAKKGNPNEKPPTTTHIVRIGCIGDRTATCFPDDYAVGIGVTSCKDGFGCSNVGPSKNMHYRCDYVYGAFSQTAFIYVL